MIECKRDARRGRAGSGILDRRFRSPGLPSSSSSRSLNAASVRSVRERSARSAHRQRSNRANLTGEWNKAAERCRPPLLRGALFGQVGQEQVRPDGMRIGGAPYSSPRFVPLSQLVAVHTPLFS